MNDEIKKEVPGPGVETRTCREDKKEIGDEEGLGTTTKGKIQIKTTWFLYKGKTHYVTVWEAL